jgi:two-component system, OmpR family, response regulator CpxR
MDSKMNRILLIDDDQELTKLLTEYLSSAGFHVDAVHTGEEGLRRALSTDYSLLVLDLMLPGIDGLELLRRLRPQSRVPVLMLTARGEDVDRIVGLEVGADDYLPKPFNPRELVARIRAILRRATADETASPQRTRIKVGDLEMDTGARTVHKNSADVELTSIEFTILEALLRAAGQIVTREHIAEAVLGRKFFAYDRSVDMHVSKLRKKLGHHPDGNERIKTIRGSGYIYTLPEEAAHA